MILYENVMGQCSHGQCLYVSIEMEPSEKIMEDSRHVKAPCVLTFNGCLVNNKLKEKRFLFLFR